MLELHDSKPVFFFYQISARLSLSDPVFMRLFFLGSKTIFLYFLTFTLIELFPFSPFA